MVIASGARYRRPEVPRLSEFEGRGIWYWASALEAKVCARQEIALVGGGNSAGQHSGRLSFVQGALRMPAADLPAFRRPRR